MRGFAPYQILKRFIFSFRLNNNEEESEILCGCLRRFGAGFSLIELMIALLIFSILLGAIYSVMSMGHTSFQTGDIQIAVQQETRKAMDKLSKEIREASSVNLASAYPFTIWGESIKYEVTNNQLLREVQGQSPTVLANNVTSIQFSLLGGDMVYITLVAQKNTFLGRSLTATLDSQVTLRN